MSHWNYRVFRHEHKIDEDNILTSYAIHEVHYHENGEIAGWTAALDVSGESLKDLQQILTMMLYDTFRYGEKILTEEELKKELEE